MDYCKHYAKEVIFPSAVKVPLHLLNLIFARVGTVMSVCVCLHASVCGCVLHTSACVCVCSLVGSGWKDCDEEVAWLSGQTGEIKRSRSTKVWLLRLPLGHCRLSNLISCRKRLTSSISGNSFIEFSHSLFSRFSHSSLRLLLFVYFCSACVHLSDLPYRMQIHPRLGIRLFPFKSNKARHRPHSSSSDLQSVCECSYCSLPDKRAKFQSIYRKAEHKNTV